MSVPIILVRLMGGLGNQMFQYAAVRALAVSINGEVALDLKTFNEDHKRNYALGAFNVSARIALENEIKRISEPRVFNRILNRIFTRKRILPPYQIYEEDLTAITPLRVPHPGDCYIVGDWQSEVYFQTIRDILLKEFVLKTPLSQPAQSYLNKINRGKSIALHVRRGDYIDNASNLAIYAQLDLSYYLKALEYIRSQSGNCRVFVFSDDIEWCKHNLDVIEGVTFIEHSGQSDFEELFLMSCCSHNIIANSSFSWWGGWLNKNPEKIVIAPKVWFNGSDECNERLIPAGWKRI